MYQGRHALPIYNFKLISAAIKQLLNFAYQFPGVWLLRRIITQGCDSISFLRRISCRAASFCLLLVLSITEDDIAVDFLVVRSGWSIRSPSIGAAVAIFGHSWDPNIDSMLHSFSHRSSSTQYMDQYPISKMIECGKEFELFLRQQSR